MRYEVKPIKVPDMDRAIRAYIKMGQVGNEEIGFFVKEMLACSLRKEGDDRVLTLSELEKIDAVEALEYFDKVMEVNADFFGKFVERVTPAVNRISESSGRT